jgi:HEAT repeats
VGSKIVKPVKEREVRGAKMHVSLKASMLRFRLWLALAVGLAWVLFPLSASAQRDVGYLSEQLRGAQDFRVRTQAALALGASADPGAVSPLCEGLDDSNNTVRSAAAAALGRLGQSGGLVCLKQHESESNASVRSVIDRAITALKGGGTPSKPPPPGPDDTFYVAIGKVTDKTGRDDDSVSGLVTSAIQEKLLSLQGYAIAPRGETAGVARKVIKKNGLKGFLLLVRVEPPAGSGDLTVQVRITMWTYPAKALQGEFAPRLTMSGASAGDVDSENQLIKMAVEKAIDNFATVAASTN